MKTVKKKNLAAFGAACVLYLLYLLFHFSIIGIGVTVLAVLCLFLSVVSGPRAGKAEYGIIDNLGDYWGLTVFDLMLVSLFSMMEKDVGTLKYMKALIKRPEFSMTFLRVLAVMLIVLAIGLFIISRIHKASVKGMRNTYKKGGMFTFILKYVLVGVGGYYMINTFVQWNEKICIAFLAVYLATNMFLEKAYNNNSNMRKASTIFYWCITNILLFVVMQYICPDYTIRFIDGLINTQFISWAWYVPAAGVLLMVLVGIISLILDQKDGNIPLDSKLCLAIGANIVMIPLSIAMYNKYIPVLYIAFGILNMVFFRPQVPGSKREEPKVKFAKTLVRYSVLACGILFLWSGFIYGYLPMALLICVTVLCGVAMYKKTSFVDGVWFWIYVILAVCVLSAAKVYQSYNSARSYLFIGFAAVVCIFAIISLNVKNKKLPMAERALKAAVALCAIILIVVPVRNFGVEYGVEIDNRIASADAELGKAGLDSNLITVTVTPRGKNNEIKECKFYWNDAEYHADAELDEDGKFTLSPRNGELHVYAVDKHGVASTMSRWFSFSYLKGQKISGVAKPFEW